MRLGSGDKGGGSGILSNNFRLERVRFARELTLCVAGSGVSKLGSSDWCETLTSAHEDGGASKFGPISFPEECNTSFALEEMKPLF